MDVSHWLAEQGLGHYAEAFAKNGIAGDILRDLTDADLKELGLNLGDRKRLLKAIAALPAAALAQDQAEAVARTAPRIVARDAERRQLTVLFCDLVGSTELSGRLDPEEMSEVIRAYHRGCADVIRRWDGYVAKYMGDGVLAYYGWPRAHEDDAERAVRAGLELAKAVGEQTASDGTKLAARIGIATGQVVVGELIGEGAAQEEAVVGETPNLAARLQALAAPGTVVIAANTRRLVGGVFDLDDLGSQRLKGFAEPVLGWRVVGERGAEGRFEARQTASLTPLVGREEEIALLLRRWRQARDGEGHVVLLSGEPGIGKSRLVRELRGRLEGEPHTRLLYQCSPHHTASPLHPVIEQLERAAAVERDDQPQAKLRKLETLLARGTDGLDQAVPLIAALLGIPTGGRYPVVELTPQRQKQRTLEVLVDQLDGLAGAQPVLLAYEDVHWIDPTTQELLGLAIKRIERLPVLALITFRPEFAPPWIGMPLVSRLTLTRLGRRDGAALVERVVRDKTLPDEVAAQIVAKTDGVPLFVEELTKAVLESGLLKDAGDRYELAGPLPTLAIPSTLHDSLMARLDRLAPVKEIAQTAAVIGREFSHDLLAVVSAQTDADLDAALDRLVAADLIFRHGVPPCATYSFKHALVQDAAYQSLLRSKRQQLHSRVADALEQRFSATAPEVFAHHLTEAGLAEKAVTYWDLAGKRAIELSAYREAIGHIERALTLLLSLLPTPERDARELDLQLALGAAWIPAKAYSADEVRRAYGTAVELSRRVGDADQRFAALRGLWNNHLMRVELSAAKDLAVQLRTVAEETGDAERRLVAERAAGSGLMALGEHLEANACFRRGIELYDPDRHKHYVRRYGEDSGLWCYGYAAWTDDWLGHRDRALDENRRATEIARKLTIPTLVMVLSNAALVHQFRREPDPTLACAEETIRLADQLGMVQLRAWASIHKGWALACGGRTEEGLAEIEAALATWRAIGGLNNRTHFLNLLADACRLAGKPEAGMAALDEAEGISRRVDLHAHDVETHRRRGELHLALGRATEAEASWLRAIEVARSQSTKTLELRATTDLARLWRDHGKGAKGHDLLAPIYAWFTEGFDTADLQEAKALLNALA